MRRGFFSREQMEVLADRRLGKGAPFVQRWWLG